MPVELPPGFPPEALGLGIVLVLLLGAILGLRIARWRASARGRAFTRAGARGEKRGLALLRRYGYRVLDVQVRTHSEVHLDGEALRFIVVADALVERRRRRYVAEFKTGHGASIGHRGTRRQLLEYARAFPGHGVLLVDADAGMLHEVSFPER